MSEPTKLPWICGHHSSIVGTPVTAQPDPTKNTLTLGTFFNHADARLSVLAVNYHQRLVDALRRNIDTAETAIQVELALDVIAKESRALLAAIDKEAANG